LLIDNYLNVIGEWVMETQTEFCSAQQIETECNDLQVASEVQTQILDNGVVKEVPNFKGIYNNSIGKTVAFVSPDFKLIQHKEYIKCFAESLDSLHIPYGMTYQQENSKVFAKFKFKNDTLKFEKLGEEFMTGLQLSNSYDKSFGVIVAPLLTRLACTNGMVLSRMGQTFTTTHRSKLIDDMKVFAETRINHLVNSFSEIQGWVSSAMENSIEWEVACRILEKSITSNKHREEILKRLGIAMIIVKKDKVRKAERCEYIFESDAVKKDKFNRWEIYNAITHYLSHGQQLAPILADSYQRKAETLLITPLETMPLVEIAPLTTK
jgi:hypothetical protein